MLTCCSTFDFTVWNREAVSSTIGL